MHLLRIILFSSSVFGLFSQFSWGSSLDEPSDDIVYINANEALGNLAEDRILSIEGEEFLSLPRDQQELVNNITGVRGSDINGLFETLNSSPEKLQLETISFSPPFEGFLNLEGLHLNAYLPIIQWPENITWINFNRTNIADEELLEYLPQNLNTLSLDDCKYITNLGISALPHSLRRIHLERTRTTNEGLRDLSSNIFVVHSYAKIGENIPIDEIEDHILKSVSGEEFLNLARHHRQLVQNITGVKQSEVLELFKILKDWEKGPKILRSRKLSYFTPWWCSDLQIEGISFENTDSLDLDGILLNSYISLFRWPEDVQSLDLSNTDISDENLQYIPEGVLHLTLNNCGHLTGLGVEHLPPDLFYLSLNACFFLTGEEFERLPQNIKYLSLDSCIRLSDTDLDEDKLPGNLRNLFLGGTRITNRKFDDLSLNFNVFHRYVEIDELPLEEVKDFIYESVSGGEFLSLSKKRRRQVKKITDVQQADCLELFRILEASLNHFQIEKVSFSNAAYLSFRNIFLNPSLASLIEWPKNLEYLDLSNTDSTDEVIRFIPSYLTKLSLNGCTKITDAVFQNLPENLEALVLSNCARITDRGLDGLHENIREIALNNTRITNRRVEDFPEDLNVIHSYIKIGEERLLYLRDSVYRSVSGEELLDRVNSDFYNLVQNITDVQQSEVVELFNILNTFSEVCTPYNISFADTEALSLEGIYLNPYFVSRIEWPKNLEELNLGETGIADEALQFIPEISSLSLEGCKDITGSGINNLSQTLKVLNLSNTMIIDQDLGTIPGELEQLIINNCSQITNSGLGFIQRQRQNMEIKYDNCDRIIDREE